MDKIVAPQTGPLIGNNADLTEFLRDSSLVSTTRNAFRDALVTVIAFLDLHLRLRMGGRPNSGNCGCTAANDLEVD
jgi:hypothetical protein